MFSGLGRSVHGAAGVVGSKMVSVAGDWAFEETGRYFAGPMTWERNAHPIGCHPGKIFELPGCADGSIQVCISW